MYYAKYFKVQNDKVVEALASDSYFPLDGRKTKPNMIIDAMENSKRKSAIHRFIGFQIRKGTHTNYCNVTGICFHDNRNEQSSIELLNIYGE